MARIALVDCRGEAPLRLWIPKVYERIFMGSGQSEGGISHWALTYIYLAHTAYCLLPSSLSGAEASTTMSTRRFWARPSTVSLPATG